MAMSALPPDIGATGLMSVTPEAVEVIIIRSDGAARGNPGPAGVGVVISGSTGDILEEAAEYIGETTNNVAEYKGILLGLRLAARYRPKTIKAYLDSELVVNQLNGVYKVKNATLKDLHADARSLISKYDRVYIGHVPRAQNAAADKLANRAIDDFEAGGEDVVAATDIPGQGSLF